MKPGSRPFLLWTKLALWLLLLSPVLYLGLAAFSQFGLGLGANPVEKLLHELGKWGLKILLLTLAVTPLRRLTGWNWLNSYRRLLGLFSFFYILLHVTVYAVLDRYMDWSLVLEDIVKRPYITLGMAALLMLIPLAVTSTRGMMRRLGRRWRALHRLVYPIAILAVWHFYWQVKLDTVEALIYAVLLSLLLGSRVWMWIRRKRRLAAALRTST